MNGGGNDLKDDMLLFFTSNFSLYFSAEPCRTKVCLFDL